MLTHLSTSRDAISPARNAFTSYLRWGGWFAIAIAVLIALTIVSQVRRNRATVAEGWHSRNRLKMLAAKKQIETFVHEIELTLQLVSTHPDVRAGRPECRPYLQQLYEANYDRHKLAEFYIMRRDFDGTHAPMMTFERGDEETEAEELHTLKREAAEYAVQIEHIRRFANDPQKDFLISEPVDLCVGGPGLVFSSPIRSNGEFTGIVAGMVRSTDISETLEGSSLGNQIILANSHGSVFGCMDLDSKLMSWFQRRFDQQGVPAFFEGRKAFFSVGKQNALWTPVDLPGDQQWYLAFVFDEADALQTNSVGGLFAEWGVAGLVLVLGCAVALLCRVVRASLSAREEAALQARALADIEAQTQAAADGIITIDEHGVIDAANAAAERIFGYGPNELPGQKITELMPAPDNQRHHGYIADYLRTNQSKILGTVREVEGKRKDGSVFPLELAVSEARVPGRRLFTGIVQDITYRKQTEAAIRDSEQRLQSIIDNTTHVVYVLDSEGRYLLINRRFEEVYHVAREESIGRTMHDLLPAAKADELEARHREVLREQKPEELQEVITLDDGVHAYNTIEFPLCDADEKPYAVCGISADVTEQKRAEQDVRQRDAELAHLARLSLMGEMAAGLAHELNQPLAAIATYAHACQERLQAKKVDKEKVRAAIADVAAQARRAGSIIQRMRQFVRKEIPEPRSMDLNSIIQDVANLVDFETRNLNIEVRYELADSLPLLRGDPVQIQQVILNLVRNAFEAFRDSNTGERRLTLGTRMASDGTVLCTVQDTGPGFKPGSLERAFESFYTSKPDGMGMGLPICRSIIERHGGRLWGTAGEKGGATFQFSLPLTNGESTCDF